MGVMYSTGHIPFKYTRLNHLRANQLTYDKMLTKPMISCNSSKHFKYPMAPRCYASQHTHKQHLLQNKKRMTKNLENAMSLALRDCNAHHHISHKDNRSCAVIWSEIEEAASMIHKIEKELMLIKENERECWDVIECKIYDV